MRNRGWFVCLIVALCLCGCSDGVSSDGVSSKSDEAIQTLESSEESKVLDDAQKKLDEITEEYQKKVDELSASEEELLRKMEELNKIEEALGLLDNDSAEPTEGEITEAAEVSVGDELLTLGTVENGRYENDTLEIGFDIQDWIVASREEIAESNGITKELINDALEEEINTLDSVMLFFVKSPDELSNVNLQVGKLSLAERLTFAGLSEEEIVDIYIDGACEMLAKTMEAVGYTNIKTEKSEALFLGEKHYVVLTTGEFMGIKSYQKQAFYFHSDYSVIISTSSAIVDGTDAILARFYKP